jgi:hypothetical protein
MKILKDKIENIKEVKDRLKWIQELKDIGERTKREIVEATVKNKSACTKGLRLKHCVDTLVRAGCSVSKGQL